MSRELVLPGDFISKGKFRIKNTYIEDDSVYSAVTGLMERKNNIVKVLPLHGKYAPAVDDTVVVIVTLVKFGGYVVDLNSPYDGFLLSEDRNSGGRNDRFRGRFERKPPLHIGDVAFATITEVDEVKNITLEDYEKLGPGFVMEISPVKVPRVVGKEGSMIKMLKDKTGCRIAVGKNGRIWISGNKVKKAKEAIEKIEREAHTPGLTDRVKDFLER